MSSAIGADGAVVTMNSFVSSRYSLLTSRSEDSSSTYRTDIVKTSFGVVFHENCLLMIINTPFKIKK